MALLSSYPNVACYAATIEDLVSKLNVKEDSILEVDVPNETVRLKTGWDKVCARVQTFSLCFSHFFSAGLRCTLSVIFRPAACFDCSYIFMF